MQTGRSDSCCSSGPVVSCPDAILCQAGGLGDHAWPWDLHHSPLSTQCSNVKLQPPGRSAEVLPPAGHGMSQRELIAAAFAGDDVQADFQAAKAAEVEAELPQEDLPQELPGWGLWASQRKVPPQVAHRGQGPGGQVSTGNIGCRVQGVGVGGWGLGGCPL